MNAYHPIIPFCASRGLESRLADVEDPAKVLDKVALSLSVGGGKALLGTTCGGSAGKLLSRTTAPPGIEFELVVLGILLLFLRLAIKLS